jgi:hypothetical protein
VKVPPMNAPYAPAAPTATLTIADAQHDMRDAYLDGGLGVLTSGTAWLVAGFACLWQSPERAVWTLFVGGMLIHPVAVLLLKALGRRGTHARGNPLGTLALATTFWMILALPLVYAASLVRIAWFFPAMLLVIGGRYLCFSTVYGLRLYWAFGAVLALAGWALGSAGAPPALGAFSGAAIELVFGCVILAGSRARAAS